MHHVSAYHNSALAAVADTDCPAITDLIIPVQNSHFLFQQDMYVQLAATLSATMTRAKFNAADLRQVTNPYIIPVNQAALPANNPNVADYRQNPLKLSKLEEVGVLQTGTSAGEDAYAVIFISPSPTLDSVPAGQTFSFRFTSTTAATKAVWSALSTTFQDTLPGGNYGVVGFEIQSTNMIAGRMILPNQTYRPGSLGITSLANRGHDAFYKGRLGLWGRFTSTYLPVIEVLCNAADASFEGYIEIIRLP